ncbi:MAG: hypothetical protein COV36_06830 [Alphaproteobacteria bacterium CG11_big_fil_rev_8_21_14_0_20_44_7]|nr:MAG: hypothetical protein COV36_06830 [Alphaproteobacteria bacterium CG11_big_fil_rev_8_21_14_0_20_44_7]
MGEVVNKNQKDLIELTLNALGAVHADLARGGNLGGASEVVKQHFDLVNKRLEATGGKFDLGFAGTLAASAILSDIEALDNTSHKIAITAMKNALEQKDLVHINAYTNYTARKPEIEEMSVKDQKAELGKAIDVAEKSHGDYIRVKDDMNQDEQDKALTSMMNYAIDIYANTSEGNKLARDWAVETMTVVNDYLNDYLKDENGGKLYKNEEEIIKFLEEQRQQRNQPVEAPAAPAPTPAPKSSSISSPLWDIADESKAAEYVSLGDDGRFEKMDFTATNPATDGAVSAASAEPEAPKPQVDIDKLKQVAAKLNDEKVAGDIDALLSYTETLGYTDGTAELVVPESADGTHYLATNESREIAKAIAEAVEDGVVTDDEKLDLEAGLLAAFERGGVKSINEADNANVASVSAQDVQGYLAQMGVENAGRS